MSEDTSKATSFYTDNYEVIAEHPLRQRQKIFIRDHETDADRTCRFCGRSAPEAKFGRDTQAHAVPEFLGNRCLYSLNECESCNSKLSTGYEDHLSKATIVMRSVARITGKKGTPTYKSDDGSWEIRSTEKGLEIYLNDISLKPELESAKAPFDFPLPGPSSSQPFIPLRAAMTLIKAACSVCPHEHLDQLRPAIKCLNGEITFTTSRFPVFYTLTPGPIT
jgi:hypothetical protein